MLIKTILSKATLQKQFEQTKTCSKAYNANSLPDTFINSNSQTITFKGDITSSFTSRLLNLFRKRPFKAAPSELPKLKELTSPKVTTSELSQIEELTPKKVAEKLNSQLAYFRESDIEKIVNCVNPENRELGMLSLAYMSQWGSFESLNALTSNLAKENKTLYSEYKTCLSNSIGYLKDKGSFRSLKFENIHNYVEIKDKGLILIDEFVLNRLVKDKKLVDFLKQHPDIQLCYPDGWIDGINPFNQASIDEVGKIVNNITNKAKIFLAKDKCLTNKEAISKAINESVVSRLNELGLKDRLKIINGQQLEKNNISLKSIAEHFKNREISADYLQGTLETAVPEEYRHLMLDAINSEAKIFDSRKMSLAMQEQYKKILDLAKQKNVSPEDLSYFVYSPQKSYGIIALQFQATNKIPVNRFIDDKNNIQAAKKIIIALDDYAGSGKSFINVALETDNKDIILSPMVATKKAVETFKAFTNRRENQVKFMPLAVFDNFKDSAFYNSQMGEKRSLLDNIFRGKDDVYNNSSIILPYMAPDNNNSFFNEFIAPEYLLNGHGAKFSYFRWSDIKEKL